MLVGYCVLLLAVAAAARKNTQPRETTLFGRGGCCGGWTCIGITFQFIAVIDTGQVIINKYYLLPNTTSITLLDWSTAWQTAIHSPHPSISLSAAAPQAISYWLGFLLIEILKLNRNKIVQNQSCLLVILLLLLWLSLTQSPWNAAGGRQSPTAMPKI